MISNSGRRRRACALAVAASFTCTAAEAARPLLTDDARIVAPKSCQVESWVRRNRDSTELWALPACNFTGNLELTLGGAATHEDHVATKMTDVLLQGKTVFRTLEPDGWSIGLAAGMVRHPADVGHHSIGEAYAYVPASFSFLADRFVMHTNAGWTHNRDAGFDRPTWGVGSETRLAERTWLVAETFDQGVGVRYQLGFRHWIVPDRVQIDVTYGNRFRRTSEDQWFSIGLRLLSPAFLP